MPLKLLIAFVYLIRCKFLQRNWNDADDYDETRGNYEIGTQEWSAGKHKKVHNARERAM